MIFVRNFLVLADDFSSFGIRSTISMKKLPILRYLASAILPFLAMASAANGALVLYYNFDSDTGANGSSAINSAGGTNGTYRQGTTTPIGTTTLIASQAGVFGTNSGTVGGKALSLTPNNNGDENVAPPHIDTNAAASVFGFINAVNSDYTAMAWVRFANQTGDNMVFGQGDGNRLHLGSRGNQSGPAIGMTISERAGPIPGTGTMSPGRTPTTEPRKFSWMEQVSAPEQMQSSENSIRPTICLSGHLETVVVSAASSTR